MNAETPPEITLKRYNYKLKIAYDGTLYSGWQMQPNGLSIQEVLQEAICKILNLEVKIIGSGRTDAGVHALAQIANFHSEKKIDLRRFYQSINSIIPKDIRVLDVSEVPLEFHAQYKAKRKVYHYHIALGKVQLPFKRLYATHFTYPFDLDLLRKASLFFVGTHDFTSFANQAYQGSAAIDPIRTLYRLDIIEEEGGIRLEFEGDGFLNKMVRNIVGTLLDVVVGNIDIEAIAAIFAARDRRKAGQLAPPQGLFLVEVVY